MKKTLFIFLLSFLGNGLFSQDYKSHIRTDFSDYLNSIINMDFEKSMNYVLPEFFEIIPKSLMIQAMEQTFNDPSMEFELKDAEIHEINDSQIIDGKHYAFLTYSNQMNMRFIPQEEETEDEKKLRVKLTKISLEGSFGEENVSYNEATRFFEILVMKKVYAISNNGESEWKFLVMEEAQKPILQKLLPKKLLDDF